MTPNPYPEDLIREGAAILRDGARKLSVIRDDLAQIDGCQLDVGMITPWIETAPVLSRELDIRADRHEKTQTGRRRRNIPTSAEVAIALAAGETVVVDEFGHRLTVGAIVESNALVGVVTRITDPDGDAVDGRQIGIPPRVSVAFLDGSGDTWPTSWLSRGPNDDPAPYLCDEVTVTTDVRAILGSVEV